MNGFYRRLTISLFLMMTLPLIAQGATGLSPKPEPHPLSGIDKDSGITYSLISMDGKLLGAVTAPTPPPRLTAQCTRDAAGKLRFELLADFGGIAEIAYFPPWKRTHDEIFAPHQQRDQVIMEFLGYTKVKPMKRQWFLLQQPAGEMKYATPGTDSTNMEEAGYYMQYLRSLPTLRLTVAGKGTLEFETTKWQAMIKAEPLCKASGL